MSTATGTNRNLVLAAMIFAVAMTFIDQTIVWVNIPVALIALVLTFMAKPENEPVHPRLLLRQ